MSLNFFWPNVKVLVNTLLTSYKPSSMDVFSSRNRCFSHFSIWSIYKVGCRQVAQYISRLALSIVFKNSFFRVQWSSNIFCQLLKTESTWISKTPLIVPHPTVVLMIWKHTPGNISPLFLAIAKKTPIWTLNVAIFRFGRDWVKQWHHFQL